MPKLRIPKAKEKPKDFSKMPWTEDFRVEFPTQKVAQIVNSGVPINDVRDYLFAEKHMDFRKSNLVVEAYKSECCIVRNDNEVLLNISVPICENQCSNCDRQIYKRTNKCFKDYFDALLFDVIATREIILKRGYFVKSVCFTGNVLVFSAEELSKLLSLCAYTLNEICIELSDAKLITEQKMAVLRKYPNVRFILNALTFNMVTLRVLNKHFEFREVYDYLKLIISNGFDISVRLVVGIGKERELQLGRNLKYAIELGASCIDLYSMHCPKIKNAKLPTEDRYPAIRRLHEYSNDFLLEQRYSPYFLYCSDIQGGCFENVGYCLPNKKCKYIEDSTYGISTMIGCGLSSSCIKVNNLHKTKEILNTTGDLCEYISNIKQITKTKREFFE